MSFLLARIFFAQLHFFCILAIFTRHWKEGKDYNLNGAADNGDQKVDPKQDNLASAFLESKIAKYCCESLTWLGKECVCSIKER